MENQRDWLETWLSELWHRHRLGLILMLVIVVVVAVPLMTLGMHALALIWPPWAVASSIVVVFVIGPSALGAAYRRNKRFSEIEKRLDKLEGK